LLLGASPDRQIAHSLKRRLASEANHLEFAGRIAQLALGAHDEHGQAIQGGGQHAGVTSQKHLVGRRSAHHEARQQTTLGRAVTGQSCLGRWQMKHVLRELAVQETGRIGSARADQTPVNKFDGNGGNRCHRHARIMICRPRSGPLFSSHGEQPGEAG